jgi:esterase
MQLAKSFHVFAIDQRNHGQSPHSDEMNYQLMAADLNEFMETYGLATAMVLGHSMGGKTAMEFALRFPNRVEKLVIADMAPRAYEPAHAEILAALFALNLKSFGTRQEIEEALAPEIPNPILRRFLLKNLGRNIAGEFFWKINLQGIAENYPRLREPISPTAPFTGPTLFIRGTKSNYINPEDGSAIFQLFPHSEIQNIAGAGHWVHADQPAEFLRLALNFLQRI